MHLRLSFESLMDDDTKLYLKLAAFASNIKLEMLKFLDSFLSFLRTYEEKKHIKCCIRCLTLGLRIFVLFFHMLVNDKKCLLRSNMIGKCCIPCWSSHTIIYIMFVNQDANKDCGLDIFQMTSNSANTTKGIVTKELLDLKRFHVDVKDMKNLLQRWEKHESKFPCSWFFCKANL